jgi:hypothetical protein
LISFFWLSVLKVWVHFPNKQERHFVVCFFITHLDICHLDSERYFCIAAAETAMLRVLTSECSVSDIQHCTHVHICSDVKPTVVTATFTDWLIAVMILSRKEICEAFLYIDRVNETAAIVCLLAFSLSFIEADDQYSEARSSGQASLCYCPHEAGPVLRR